MANKDSKEDGVFILADFEGLIRQALARHDATDPAIRERVYQSSRNALARMIAAAGAQPVDAIEAQRRALENSIARIEAAYAEPPRRRASEPAPIPPAPARPAPEPRAPELQPERRTRPEVAAEPRLRADPRLDPPAVAAEEDPGEFADAYAEPSNPVLRPRSRSLPRLLGFLAIVAVLGVLGWLAWSAVSPFLNNPEEIVSRTPPAGSDPEEAAAVGNASYVTILSPTDTSGLQVSGRGKADIVRHGEADMIRLVSLRPASARDTAADPILVEIGPGALQELAGRKVTVEIQAKSGGFGPATFAVGCDFDGQDACGRKRFRLGLQPEAIVFTIEIPQKLSGGGKAYLTVNTDVTSTASSNGEGDAIDIAYARLRYTER